MRKGYCKDCGILVSTGGFLDMLLGKIPEGSRGLFIFKDGIRCPDCSKIRFKNISQSQENRKVDK